MKHALLILALLLLAPCAPSQLLTNTWGIPPQSSIDYPATGPWACQGGQSHPIFSLRLVTGQSTGNLVGVRMRSLSPGSAVDCLTGQANRLLSGAPGPGYLDVWIGGLSPAANGDWVHPGAPTIPLGVDPWGFSFVAGIGNQPISGWLTVPWPGYGGWIAMPPPYVVWANTPMYLQVIRVDLTSGQISAVSNRLSLWWTP